METISEKTVERLILYKRILAMLQSSNRTHVYSHELANIMGISSAQLRRDIMVIGYSGSPAHGYQINELMNSISLFIDAPEKQAVALVGAGRLGRAVLDYIQGRSDRLDIVALFDVKPEKVDRVIHGCRCHPIDKIDTIIPAMNIKTAILSVPADQAQTMAERLVKAGVRGLLNYAPLKLNLSSQIYIENRDMLMAVEKVSYFARNHLKQEGLS